MPEYKIWEDNEEQWDPANIDPPKAVIEARNATAASEQFAEEYASSFDSEIRLILQAFDGTYLKTVIGKRWEVDELILTTLEELCAE